MKLKLTWKHAGFLLSISTLISFSDATSGATGLTRTSILNKSSDTSTNPPLGEAQRSGMITPRWTSAKKQFLGTAYEAYDANGGYSDTSPTAPISRVWFTGASGALTEIFWPSIDTPQVIDSQFLVTDGSNLFEERKDAQTKVEWLGRGVPAFHVTNTDPRGRFTIEKTIFTDTDRDAVIQHVRVTRNVSGLKFFYLHKPGASNTPMGNSAKVSLGGKSDSNLAAGLYAWQARQAQAVLFSVPLHRVSAGFSGSVSDGYQDIRAHATMVNSFETATQGNVSETAWLEIPEEAGTTEFNVVIGFSSSIQEAGAVAQKSLNGDIASMQAKYISQWKTYQSGIYDLSSASLDGGNIFRASVAVLKTSEDKTRAGAFVASPTIPWGEHSDDTNSDLVNGSRSKQTGGYHMVWPRDLYQIATSFMAVKDDASAVAALNFLKSVQFDASSGTWSYGARSYPKNGSFSQNTWTNGEPYWAGLQMDEVAMPISLAYRLWKAGKIEPAQYWDMVSRAADLLVGYGPWSPMERWEESFGASPSTIAAEISGLRAAARFATEMNDTARAFRYQQTADAWSLRPGDNIETWTFTSTGGFGNGHYYTRIQGAASNLESWNPNSEQTFNLANNAGVYREKDILDGGFLELVRFGIRDATDPAIAVTVPIYDAQVGTMMPGIGIGYRRYNHDRYNYDDATGTQTAGMMWPLLTGERGHYEIQKALESRATKSAVDAIAVNYIGMMEKMATPQFFLPEQVWDSGPLIGQSTGSATPLGWSHAEYLKLLRSRADHVVFDRVHLPSK
jgi:glucoamylase